MGSLTVFARDQGLTEDKNITALSIIQCWKPEQRQLVSRFMPDIVKAVSRDGCVLCLSSLSQEISEHALECIDDFSLFHRLHPLMHFTDVWTADAVCWMWYTLEEHSPLPHSVLSSKA
jgi:hypothetical protein